MGSTQRAKSNGFLMAVCCGQRPAYGCRVPGWRRRQELLMSVCDRLAARRGAETARDFAQARAGDLERKRTRGSELGAARLALACLVAVPAACCLLSLLAGTSLPPPHLQKEIVYPGRAGTSPGYVPFLARPVCARSARSRPGGGWHREARCQCGPNGALAVLAGGLTKPRTRPRRLVWQFVASSPRRTGTDRDRATG